MKENIGFDPKKVGLFGAGRVLLEPQRVAVLFEQFLCFWGRFRQGHIIGTFRVGVYNLYIGYYTNNLPYNHPYGVLYGEK